MPLTSKIEEKQGNTMGYAEHHIVIKLNSSISEKGTFFLNNYPRIQPGYCDLLVKALLTLFET